MAKKKIFKVSRYRPGVYMVDVGLSKVYYIEKSALDGWLLYDSLYKFNKHFKTKASAVNYLKKK